MKIIKFAMLLLALCGLTVILSRYYAGQPQISDTGRMHIVYVYKTTAGNIEFWNNVTEGIVAAAKEFDADYDIIGAREETDIAGNIAAVAEAIEMKPDAIVLTATDYELLEPAAKSVVDAGILLLTMDSDAAGGFSRCFIATDNFELGRYMGEEMAKREPEGKIGIVSHIKGTGTAIGRISGALEGLGGGAGRAMEPVYCDNHVEKSMELTLKMIGENPDLRGIIATNEGSAVGAAMAVAQLNKKDEITLITCDNSSLQITFLEQGVIDATVAQRPFNMGYMGVMLASELLKGKNEGIPDFFDTGCEVITRDNMFSMENQKLLFPFRE